MQARKTYRARANQALLTSVLIAMATLPATGFAQARSGVDAPDTVQETSTTEGEVRRLDKTLGTLTIRHGEIRNLDMPPMSMVFTVRDKAQLDAVSVGDRIRFVATNENGKFIASDIEAAK